MNPVYQITAQLDTLSSMASKWPPFGTKLGILPLAPKCTQDTKFQTIWTIGIDFGIWGIFVLVGKLLMHIPLGVKYSLGPILFTDYLFDGGLDPIIRPNCVLLVT